MSDPYAIPSARPSSPLPMIAGLRRDVDAWRSSNYPGASSTSRRLLEHWFLDDHQTPDGLPFSFYFAQREAIETIIYLHEVVRLRRTTERVARYSDRPVAAADDPYPRYVIKMATGSGKTKVMALAITWSYFHAMRETASSLATTSLVVAPNLIVLDRLATDFARRSRIPGRGHRSARVALGPRSAGDHSRRSRSLHGHRPVVPDERPSVVRP